MAMAFVPHALMTGFCSGAAIVIALSQMTNIMGKFYTLKHALSCCLHHCLETEVLFLPSRYVEAGGGKVIVYYE
jgi:MFS superfamily sulfate permease-like transporter